MKLRLLVVILAAVGLASLATWAPDRSLAQQSSDAPPEFRVLVLQGTAKVGSQDAKSGWRITARIGSYESEPVPVGELSAGRYVGLVVGPSQANEGKNIEFWMEGQVKAAETAIFGPLNTNGTYCVSCSWSLPISRTVNLTFPSAPVATPTPTLTPTRTPVIAQPSFYSGRVITGNIVPEDGTRIIAVIDDYTSAFADISGGKYQLVVDPKQEKYIGKNVEFFIERNNQRFKAAQTVSFAGGAFREDLNLIFPLIPTVVPLPTNTPVPPPTNTPTPTPVPTATNTPVPTPTATFTPEPTRTPTPMPVPTNTATATSTPTALPNLGATATALAITQQGNNNDDGCNLFAPGSVSGGMVSLLLLPVGLAAWVRVRRGLWK